MVNDKMARDPGSDKILSLVVPTYNMEKYLPACLDSVTDELIGDSLEVIVVNDGSTDRSPDIIRQYEQKRPDLIKVIDKPNGHYGSCVNAGLAVATGKYFKILDADDWFDTQALAAFLHKLETCDTDLVITLRVDELFDGDQKVDEQKHSFNTVFKDHVYQAAEFSIRTHAYESEFGMNGMAYKTRLLRDMGDKARWVAVGKGKLTPGESLPFAVGYEGGRLSVSVTPGTDGMLCYSAAFDGAETKDERFVAEGRSLLLVFRGDADRLFRVMGVSGERGADAEALLVVVVNVAAE